MANTKSEGENVAAPEQEVATETPERLTFDEVIAQRTQEMANRATAPREEVQDEAPDVPEEPEEEETPPDQEDDSDDAEDESIAQEEESEQDVLSQFDLESLTPEQLEELGREIKSKVPKRFGELTAKWKSAEEKAELLQRQINELKTENPFKREQKVDNNPFDDVETLEGLQEQWNQFSRIEEWADDLLDENEDSSLDEVITTEDGKDLTKRQVKQYLKKAKQAREKFLPARLQVIQQTEAQKQVESQLTERAKSEFEWYGDDESDLRKEYDLILNDPRVKRVAQTVPDIMPQLKYMLTHFVDSFAKKNRPAPKQKAAKPKLTPPSNPTSTSAPSRGDDKGNKELNKLKERLANSNSYSDFASLRAKQRS